ncbi:MAG: RDD family protein [Gaiellaceae bacterium]
MEAGTLTGASTGALTAARAGFWRRFAAALIDGILLGIVSGILRAILGGSGTGLGFIVAIAYYTYFHGSTGQTPGDAALSIRIVDKQTGQPIGYGRAFIRWLVSIVSGAVLLLGYLWMLWDSEKQTWHDKAANDVVVPA